MRYGRDLPSGGKTQFSGQAHRRYPSGDEKGLLSGQLRPPGAGGGGFAERHFNPANKLPYEYPQSVELRSYHPNVKGHTGQIKKGLQALLAARQPVIYAGGGVISANCHAQLTALAKRLNLPVTTSLMGLGAFPGDDPQCLGMLGMHGTYEANMAMHHADLIFGIGVRFDDRTTNNLTKYCPQATILHIDIDPTSISKTVGADIPIVGSADNVLNKMLALLDESDDAVAQQAQARSDWWHQIATWRARECLNFDTSGPKIKPQAVIAALHKLTGGDAYVASDVGQHQMFAALYYPFAKPRRWINSGGLGTMGFGFPQRLASRWRCRKSKWCA